MCSHRPKPRDLAAVVRSLVIAVLAVPVIAPAAVASTVSVDAGVLLVVAAPGEANQVSISERGPDGPGAVSGYAVQDSTAGATPGPGCALEPSRFAQAPVSVCPATGLQRVLVRLGDGDDVLELGGARLPVEAHGESGRDRIQVFSLPGSLADGGDGDDQLDGAEVVRGGPGNDRLTGTRQVEGGDGDDALRKTGGRTPGRLDAGAGNDTLAADDGQPDALTCGEGRDQVVSADDADRPDSTCESGRGVAVPDLTPRVTVFELPGYRSRPGRDGRLAVWMKCSVPACAVTVQIRAAGAEGTKTFVAFRPGHAPVRRLVVGTKAELVRLALTPRQRRAFARTLAGDLLAAKVTASGPGGRTSLFTDGGFCSRRDPCGPPPSGPR